ncbi:DUF4917 family protein [uncultured Psychrosphaera sp.]|uniref:DUF4917 family protein n=1 Tax=uncultured Psychrosphaera sp. TaxID=1403522 RepID=UPI00260E2F44|nr:DUF4917 family protein [uncultured Psychrosphaera sp.]
MKLFAQVLEEIEDKEVSLLLGNGFSQAWDYNIFNYKNLLASANFGSRDQAIKSIFHKLGTYDFETVMQTMISSIYVSQSFNEYPAFVEGIQLDAEKLKSTLVTTIADTHPSVPNNITNEQYELARNFLNSFNNIFTLNYDLLMYWARNMNELEPDNFTTDDGFRGNRTWTGEETDQNVFFLHGGLHLYDEGGVIKKHTYTEYGETIIDQVKANLDKNNFPIFVAEPNHHKKLDKILHNPYLNYCYTQLGKISDSLVIYGHSMDETDTHIFDKVDRSGIRDVYVSIYGDANSWENRRTKANALSSFSTCTVHFYQAESTHIWNEL